jgi:hypothetical protein
MPGKQKHSPKILSTSTRRHAAWVRAHPQIDSSAFPSYPDEPSRRGSSRGALPNGNPWRSELIGEMPGEPGSRPSTASGPPSTEPQPRPATRPTTNAPLGGPITVQAPPSEPRPVAVTSPQLHGADLRIAGEIEARLANSKILEGERVELDVDDGEVVLRGRVPNAETRSEAGAIASSVRGVTRVLNRIRVVER